MDEAQPEEKPAQTEEELNALSNVKRFFCNKKGHYTSQCPLKKKGARVRARARAKAKAQTREKAKGKPPRH